MSRILVIEDDQLLNGGLCFNLQNGGYETIPVYDLKSAYPVVESQKFDLMLLDVNLPDGSEVTVRQMPFTAMLSPIFASSRTLFASMVSVAECLPLVISHIFPISSTIPVNIGYHLAFYKQIISQLCYPAFT